MRRPVDRPRPGRRRRRPAFHRGSPATAGRAGDGRVELRVLRRHGLAGADQRRLAPIGAGDRAGRLLFRARPARNQRRSDAGHRGPMAAAGRGAGSRGPAPGPWATPHARRAHAVSGAVARPAARPRPVARVSVRHRGEDGPAGGAGRRGQVDAGARGTRPRRGGELRQPVRERRPVRLGLGGAAAGARRSRRPRGTACAARPQGGRLAGPRGPAGAGSAHRLGPRRYRHPGRERLRSRGGGAVPDRGDLHGR